MPTFTPEVSMITEHHNCMLNCGQLLQHEIAEQSEHETKLEVKYANLRSIAVSFCFYDEGSAGA